MNCSMTGCEAKARTKGLCHKHYNGEYRKKNAERIRAYQRSAYTPMQVRDMNLRHIYGVSLVGFEALAAAQGGVCKICGRPPRDKKKVLHIDHCHKTNKIRGLLCLQCNVLLGKAEDSVETLQKAIDYLKSSG